LTIYLWNLDTLELRNIIALLLGEAATLSVGSLGALSSWNSLALFLLNSFTLSLLDIITLLLGHVFALLGGHITALLLVMNLLADLFGNWVAFLAINSFTLTARNIPALLLWDLGALSFVDYITLLGRNILTNLFLDSLALFLIDNLALGFSICSALLLINRTTLIFKRGTALLIILSGALFFMDSLRNSSWNADTFQLWNIVALLILNGAALLPGVLRSLTVLPVLEATLFARDRLLYRSLRDLTLPFLNISTNGVGNIATLLLGDGLIRSLWNLVTDFLGNLSTNWFWRRSCSLDGRRVKLKRQLGAKNHKGKCD